jgi:hypothetical protein
VNTRHFELGAPSETISFELAPNKLW